MSNTTNDDLDKILDSHLQEIKAGHDSKLKLALTKYINEQRIAEREYAWKLINDIRYERVTLTEARNLTLHRLSELQVESQLEICGHEGFSGTMVCKLAKGHTGQHSVRYESESQLGDSDE